MRLKNLDLIIAMSIASMNVVWAMLPNHTPLIGSVLALPLVFVLPGYTLTEALFHKQPLDASHRLIFSLGLSVAIDALSGFILNILPVGLQAKSWAVLLGLLTALFSLLVANLRRRASSHKTHQLRFRLRIHEWILFGLSIIVVTQAIFYSAVGAAQQRHPGFTQLWMLPPAQGGRSCVVRLGMRNLEATPVTYSITMTLNETELAAWPSIALAPQEEWDRLIPIIPGATDKVYVEARLYRLDKPKSLYQHVNLTFPAEMANYCRKAKSSPGVYPTLGEYGETMIGTRTPELFKS